MNRFCFALCRLSIIYSSFEWNREKRNIQLGQFQPTSPNILISDSFFVLRPGCINIKFHVARVCHCLPFNQQRKTKRWEIEKIFVLIGHRPYIQFMDSDAQRLRTQQQHARAAQKAGKIWKFHAFAALVNTGECLGQKCMANSHNKHSSSS